MMGHLGQLLTSIGAPRILVVGDLILDRYVWGVIDRISPEAPISILDVRREEFRPGGAGNAANNLASLEARVLIAGIVGDDADGVLMREQLEGLGVDVSCVLSDLRRRTTVKTRMIAHDQQVLRVDQETRVPLSPTVVAEFEERILSMIPECDAVLLSDYRKGVLSESFIQAIIHTGTTCGVKTLIDPKGGDYARYRGAFLLTPNRSEVEVACGESIQTDEKLFEVGERLRAELDLQALVITLGKDGISLFEAGRPGQILAARARAVYDVSGAGDTVLAVLGLAIASGIPLDHATRIANVAGGVVVGQVGVVPITRKDLARELATPAELSLAKIVHRDELVTRLNEIRERGGLLVFTNGCYDLLHAGHISLLQFARRQGDVLVVGVNSDRSVRALKGPARPIVGETDRVRLLSALADVDYVVIFDEETPEELIRTIHPDVLVKGEDWRGQGVVGQEWVESRGGRVEYCPLMGGLSTSAILQRIHDRFAMPGGDGS